MSSVHVVILLYYILSSHILFFIITYPIPNMDITLLAQERRHVTKYSTPTKKPRMNLLIISDIKRMMTVHARSSLQILDSGAGISGVAEQWKMTDISRSSTYSVQGACGEPIVINRGITLTWRSPEVE